MLFKMEGFDCIILKLKFERVFQHILLSLGFRSWWMGFSNSIPIMEGSILGHFNSFACSLWMLVAQNFTQKKGV